MTQQNESWGLQAATNADSEPIVKSSVLLESVCGGNGCLSDQYGKLFGD